jgi:hypothetical protein
LPSHTQGGSRVREFRSRGSVRGAVGNDRPYREHHVNESSPPQRCGVHGIVPESSQFVVKKRYRNRAPGHFERGDVRTYQRPGNGKPALFQNAPRGIVHEIELEPWRAAEAIDEQQNAA